MNYKILTGNKIPLKAFIKIDKLDAQVYTNEYRIPFLKGLAWVIRNRDGYVVALNEENEAIGYISMVSLKEKYFNEIKNGTLIDSKIPLKGLSKFKNSGIHYVYFASIVVDEKYRNSMVALDLLAEAEKLLLSFSQKGSIVKYILIDAVSKAGVMLSHMYKGKECIKSNHGSTIYLIDLPDSTITYSSQAMNELAAISKQV